MLVFLQYKDLQDSLANFLLEIAAVGRQETAQYMIKMSYICKDFDLYELTRIS